MLEYNQSRWFFARLHRPGTADYNLLQIDIGVNEETTTTTAQFAAREEFARSPKNRQQGRVAS